MFRCDEVKCQKPADHARAESLGNQNNQNLTKPWMLLEYSP